MSKELKIQIAKLSRKGTPGIIYAGDPTVGTGGGIIRVASKAEQIRQVAKDLGGRIRSRDIIHALAERGVEVSSAQVSAVLRAMGMKRRRRGGYRLVVKATAETLTLDSLLAAKKLVQQIGSVEAAKMAIDALAKLT
jgi:hypothetical protein